MAVCVREFYCGEPESLRVSIPAQEIRRPQTTYRKCRLIRAELQHKPRPKPLNTTETLLGVAAHTGAYMWESRNDLQV